MSSSNSMQTTTCPDSRPTVAPWRANGTHSDLPGWTSRLSAGTSNTSRSTDNHEMTERTREDFTWRTVILRDAREMDGELFTARAHQAYAELLDGLHRADVFRIWNFIPGIGTRDATDQDRYMRFNAARFEAFRQHDDDARHYPTASGVGHAGDDLVLHLLAADVDVEPVDNPRQVLPEDYSPTWGAMPPVFSRSAVVTGLQGGPLLVVSGTASVRGEDTMHRDDLDKQLDETIANLSELMRRHADDSCAPRLDSMLVYVPEAGHLAPLQERIDAELAGPETEIEYRIGDLCRPNLLVEIEGTRAMRATGR
jgi:chorismate lyase/3-hydroxybenzoate synthase